MPKVAIALAWITLASTSAVNQPVEVLTEARLIGRWALDCRFSFPSAEVAYRIGTDGSAVYANSAGDQHITAATRNGSRVTMDIRFFQPVEELRTITIEFLSPNEIVPVMNRNERGEYLIRDGAAVEPGVTVGHLHRCD